MAIFGPKPWEKCQVFDFLNLLFLKPGRAISGSRISWKTFSWPILPKKKIWKKWPFLDQDHGLTPLEKCQVLDFLSFLFLYPRKEFFVLEYRKRHFPCLYCLKRKRWKMAIFGLKPWVNPFEKYVNFSTFWTFCFYSLDRHFFFLEYRKKHFIGLYCLKMAIFRPKPWVNPFGKMSIFRLFELLVFIA